MEKKCFKCNIVKPLGDYYKHKKMADGHLNKCKDCTKRDVDIREKDLRANNPEWVAKEVIRAREKYHRLGYKDIHKESPEEARDRTKQYRARYPEKAKATNATSNMKKEKGNHLHHWSYNEAHYKDVIELTMPEHNKLHRYIVYDQERFMYRRIDTMELLDTREAHIAYYESLKDKP